MLSPELLSARGKEYVEILVKDFVAYADDVNRALDALDYTKAKAVFGELVAQFRSDAQELVYALDPREADDDDESAF